MNKFLKTCNKQEGKIETTVKNVVIKQKMYEEVKQLIKKVTNSNKNYIYIKIRLIIRTLGLSKLVLKKQT